MSCSVPDHGIGRKTETNRSAGRYPTVAAGKRPGTDHVRGRKYMPHQGGAAAPSEIDTEALNGCDITLCWSTDGPEQAIEITDRPDHETRGGAGAAFKHADHGARLGACRLH